MSAWWSALPCFGQGSPAQVHSATVVTPDGSGGFYLADTAGNQVWRATVGGSLLLVAGSGVQGFAGDGGAATAAWLNAPQGLAVAADGTLYIADTGNHRLRMVTPSGQIATFAGTGTPGFGGDGGLATAASLRRPTALAIDNDGNVLVCDTGNARVRKVIRGIISTFAGSGVQGFAGDGGLASAAEFDDPEGIAVNGAGVVYVADTHNQRIRAISVAGVVSTAVGLGARGFSGDGGSALQARIAEPRGLAFDSQQGLAFADSGNQRVRKVDASGVIATTMGTGTEGKSVEGTPGLLAALDAPRAVAISLYGLQVVADVGNRTVRESDGSLGLFQPAALLAGRSSSVVLDLPTQTTYGQGTTHAVISGPVGAPAGGLAVLDNGNLVQTAAVQAGAATIDMSLLNAGSHQLTVQYTGDSLNPAAASVKAAAIEVAPAVVTVSANSVSVLYGAALPVLTGDLSGVLPRDAGSVAAVFATKQTGLVPVGTYPIQATLTGAKATDYVVALAPSSGQLTVVKAGSHAVLSAGLQAVSGVPLQLTATVTAQTAGQPTGTVAFLDGSAVVATAALHEGSASTTYAAPAGSTPQISVAYPGDANFLPDTSAPVAVAWTAIPDFSVTAVGATTATVAPGDAAQYVLLIASQTGSFTGAVSLSASGLPAGATASFSPPQVVPGTLSAKVTVTVQTRATAARAASAARAQSEPRIAMAFVCGVVLLRCGRRRRRLHRVVLLLPVALISGCGARTIGDGTGGLVAQNYSLQMVGTGTNLAGTVVSHGVPLSLTIQQ